MRTLLKLRFYLFLLSMFASCLSSVIVGCISLVREGNRALHAAPFTPYLEEYLRPPDRLAPKQPAPQVQGGFLPINMETRVVDEFYLSLPSHMRPEQPEDVKTVVWLKWKAEPVRRIRGGSLYQQICFVTVIDRASNLIVGQSTIKGPDPSARRSYGTKPIKEIIFYLYSLQHPKGSPASGATG